MSRQLRTADLFFILASLPVVLLFVLAPQSFLWFWPGMGNLGRGGFLFVYFLLGYELMDYRNTPGARLSWNRKLAIAAVVGIGLSYFGATALYKPLADLIYEIGPPGGSGGYSVSWLMATEYLGLTLYIVGLAIAFFGWRSIQRIIAGIVASAGMLIFFLLDAFFPYHELWILQAWAYFLVAAVGFAMGGLGFPVYGTGNRLTILGKYGVWNLVVFWPSVGVESMLIFSMVMIVLAAKLSVPKMRKVIYAAVGATVTIFLNVVRISMISYYGFCCATSPEGVDAFHNTIGQFLYPVWVVAYVWIVLEIERRLSVHSQVSGLSSPRTETFATQAF